MRPCCKIVSRHPCCISHYIFICHAYLISCPLVASFLKCYWLLLKSKLVVWPRIRIDVEFSLLSWPMTACLTPLNSGVPLSMFRLASNNQDSFCAFRGGYQVPFVPLVSDYTQSRMLVRALESSIIITKWQFVRPIGKNYQWFIVLWVSSCYLQFISLNILICHSQFPNSQVSSA